ncbi:DUF3842 family protein [Haloimpatiens lingqiaonensis]|uniref:DUF3842 family protein n=1 Tax=Haloimpatiens lingqiaonensis TaxID=1380675 RepID=UPI0010FE4C02|nr:DUF3842 family protein [Haloimpatiens lingqiaonensis]
MRVAVIDGLGGGLGKVIIEKIREQYKEGFEIIALGTNSLATSSMIKGGAHAAATGENAIKVMSQEVDVIIGPIAMLVANSMMGEITPVMSEAIAISKARKIILPLNRCNVITVGTRQLSMSQMVNLVIEELSIC